MSYFLLAITFITGIIKYENLFKKPINRNTWLGVSLLVIFTTASFINEYNKNIAQKKSTSIEANSGTLTQDDKSNLLIWELGGNPFVFNKNEINLNELAIPFQNKIIKPFDGLNFTASLLNDKIMVTSTIRDTVGNIIVEMVNNEWQVNRPLFAFDRNYNDTSLEVRDNTGNIVFQIELSKNKMLMHGKFVKPDGQIIMVFPIMYPKKNMPGITGIVNYESGNYHLIRNTKIRPLFKYPSSLHQGERVEYSLNDTFNINFSNIPYYPKTIHDSSKNYILLN
jgi:hypothetical protein